MIRVIQQNCARSYEWTIAALDTGVERRAEVVCLQEPPRVRGEIRINHSAYDIRKRQTVWTAIRKESGLVVDERMHFSRGANDDVIATDVRRRCEKIKRICDIYDQKDARSGERERPAQKLHWEKLIRQGGTVLAGDFNTHSKRWDPRCQVQRNAVFWEGVIDENGLEIGNDSRPTHH
jgi:endonuclease/exonuclease/phosphatase family metal-dependent hydrolase